jgi:hypothetical protein
MCSSYSMFILFSCSMREIKLLQNNSSGNESSWNIPHCISVSSVSVSSCSAHKHIVLFQSLMIFLVKILFIYWSKLTWRFWLSNCETHCWKLSDNLSMQYSVLSIYRPHILRFSVFTVRHLRSRIKFHISNVIYFRIHRFPELPFSRIYRCK